MLRDWALSKLEPVKDCPRVLLRDPLQLLPRDDGAIHSFALKEGFTLIRAATNLTFRQLYEIATEGTEVEKLLMLDQAPMRRRTSPSVMKAPPPFYPDFLADTSEEARIDLDLRQFLKETTGDPNWPADVNEPRYARLVARHLDGVLRGHENLRTAHPGRFTDHDFKTLVASAALGVAEAAFKRLNAQDYWKIGLLGHEALSELESLAPEITRPIRDELGKAPAPFCWFADHDPELVVRAFYLSAILAQHFEHWSLLLANLDPALGPLSGSSPDVLKRETPRLMARDPGQASKDLEAAEEAISREGLQLLLLDQLKLADPPNFAKAVESERYSTLIRSLALLMALDDLLSPKPASDEHARISALLFGEPEDGHDLPFVEKRPSVPWSHLKEAYALASRIQNLRGELNTAGKMLKVAKAQHLSFKLFREFWIDKGLCHLEYCLSAIERLIHSGEFLPRSENELPSAFVNALDSVRQNVRSIEDDAAQQLDYLNSRFQEMVAAQYPSWIASDTEVRLTSQLLRRCLKPHWDPTSEKAALFIFDGMRYDIWDEFLRPMLEDRMEVVKEYPASSLVPSETHISRKAISAGAPPDAFDMSASEDKLLKVALGREFGFQGAVEVLSPESTGAGETVRYRAGNLDVYIFEIADKELHGIEMKTLPDGRQVPRRPMAFVYEQHIKNIIDTEVMAIVRKLDPGAKIFVTADHGFGRIHRGRVEIDTQWLNEPLDCSYRNSLTKASLSSVRAPAKVRDNVWEFPVTDLRMPTTEKAYNRHSKSYWQKQYATVVLPKIGFALARPGSHFGPPAYTHGGISIEEMMIPMVALRVRDQDEGLLILDEINGPTEVVEGEALEFRMPIRSAAGKKDEIRVDVHASYAQEPGQDPLPQQVLYVSEKGAEVAYKFQPNSSAATDDERSGGTMSRTLTITANYREGDRSYTKSRTHPFTVKLNSERVVRRVPPSLGNILGLTPKSMR